MTLSPKRIALAVAVLGALVPARAHACSSTETQVYVSATTAWCVEGAVLSQYGTFPSAFFAYGDKVIETLTALFDVPAQGVYTFEASVPNGGAHTGSECCGLGVTVTGDAFYGSAYGATGFWGYLLSLHETINDWTGQVSSGWPTDFWADHVSAFPNSMDWHVMATIGQANGDANLTAASAAQKARFYPGGDSADPRVPMFDTIFAMPDVGYPGYGRIFGWVQADGLSWDGLGVANPDEKRSEYVAAYLSLGARRSVLPVLQGAGVCSGQPDGQNDPTYTCAEANVDAIATAHCAIAAAAAQGSDETADLQALRGGNYAAVAAKGRCGAGCPAECGCKSTTDACVAPWLADELPDGGPLDAGAGGGGAADAGAGAGGGGGSGGTSGGGGAGPSNGDAGGVARPGDAGAGIGGNGAAPGSSSAGCACTLGRADEGVPAVLAGAVLAGVALVRGASRRRSRTP